MQFLAQLEDLPLSVWVRESGSVWAYPSVLFLHTLGLSMIVGFHTAINLRVLGVWPSVRLAPLQRLYPIMWGGFWVNAVTGMILLMADATTKLATTTFYVKMAFIAVALVVLVRQRRQLFGAHVAYFEPTTASSERPEGALASLPDGARALAAVSLLCWVGAITAGRLMAYLSPVAD
jgi:hypothetical protein